MAGIRAAKETKHLLKFNLDLIKSNCKKPIVLTIDLEEWFHVVGVPALKEIPLWDKLPVRITESLPKLLDFLSGNNAKATFFIVGWIAQKYPCLIKRIVDSGHTVGNHTMYHRALFDQDRNAFREELKESIQILSDITGKKTSAFRAPSWTIKNSEWAYEILAENGITISSSLLPVLFLSGKNRCTTPHHVKTSSGNVLEIPAFTGNFLGIRIPAGGSWTFRMLGPKWSMVQEERVRKNGFLPVYWSHPYEWDESPPLFPLPFPQNFIHNHGTKKSPSHFNNLFKKRTSIDLLTYACSIYNGEALKSALLF